MEHSNGVKTRRRGGLLYPTIDRYGYCKIKLGGTGYTTVHRLVLQAFVRPCPAGYQCAHGDGKRTNNRLSNLRWATPMENYADRVRHGTATQRAKLLPHQILEIRALAGHLTGTEIARRYNIGKAQACRILRGVAWGLGENLTPGPARKLSEAAVAEILSLPDITAAELGRRYGCSGTHIRNIRSGDACWQR